LVEMHGGKVAARSSGLGQGATFVVALPVTAAHVTDDRAASSPPSELNPESLPDLTGIRVVAVDDDANSLDVVKRILLSRGAVVETAATVGEALEILGWFSPDVIVSDIGLPRQDGYSFVRQLRAMPSFASVPAVALTALARIEDRTRALNAGFQMHMAK